MRPRWADFSSSASRDASAARMPCPGVQLGVRGDVVACGIMTPEQRGALEHVTGLALAASPEARIRLRAVLATAVLEEGLAWDSGRLSVALVRRGRVAVHFHPDRLVAGGPMVGESLLRGGRYVSQFVTRISSGGLTAYAGGARDRWEQAMFGGAYQREQVRREDRPVYGALDLLRHADGPAPRFGSCFLRLRREVLDRTSLSVGDSVTQPADVVPPPNCRRYSPASSRSSVPAGCTWVPRSSTSPASCGCWPHPSHHPS
jgi:hypothetical protein